MQLLIEQFKKLTTFIIILLILFCVNLLFNLNYKWDGISIIVRVYIFLFSFYMVFTFASLDLEQLKKLYRENRGKAGEVLLFCQIRIIPLGFIYLVMVVYGLVDHVASSSWPSVPVISLLSGGYANTVIYSLILLVILKMQRDPQVTIPVFLAVSIFYLLVLDKLVYIYFGAGTAVSIIKILKFIIFIFFMLHEFFYEGKKISLYAAISIFSGLLIHGVSILFLSLFVFWGSGQNSAFYQASDRILRAGFPFPLERLEKNIMENSSFRYLPEFLRYSRLYDRNIEYSLEEWQKILRVTSVGFSDKIITYLYEKSLDLDFSFFMQKIVGKMRGASRYENLSRYASRYLKENRKEFYRIIGKSPRHVKVWAMDVAAEAHDIESLPYLIDHLSSVDAELSVNAYSAMKKITGIDPAQSEDYHANDPLVIMKFREFYQNYGKDLQ